MRKIKIISIVVGALILMFLAASYFIEVTAEQGANYVIVTPLLGIIIFYSPYVLGAYILVGVLLIILGLMPEKHRKH